MNNREQCEATARLADAVQFRQAAGGHWYPDLLVDRHALTLAKAAYRPLKDRDTVLTQLSGVCFCQFNTPPLGRRQEAERIVTAYRERQVSLDLIRARRALSAKEQARADLIARQLDELEDPCAEVLDAAATILQGI